jgi:hypothetical protein
MTAGTWSTLLVLALTAAIAPFGLIAFSLLLATGRGTKNGVAFILGWITTVVIIGIVCLAVGNAAEVDTGGAPGDVTLGIMIGLGSVLLMMWARRRVRSKLGVPEITPTELEELEQLEAAQAETPGKDDAPAKPPPAWQRKIGSIGIVGAFILGGALQPWPIMIAGGAEIAQVQIPTAEAVAVILVFAIAGAMGIIALEVLALRHPGSAAARLEKIQDYVATHRDSVINWALLIGGLWLIGRGIVGIVQG